MLKSSEPEHTNISLFIHRPLGWWESCVQGWAIFRIFWSILSEPRQIIKVILGIGDSFIPIRQEYGSVIKKCHKVRIQASQWK